MANTTNLGLIKPVTGSLDGTWGDGLNSTLDQVDEAVGGSTTLVLTAAGSSGAPNTITISTDGTASPARNIYIIVDDNADLTADVYLQLAPPEAEKLVYIQNVLQGSRDLILFQGTWHTDRDLTITAGTTVLARFDGGGAGAANVTQIKTSNTDAEIRTAASGKQTIGIPRAAMKPAKTSGAAPGDIETTAGRPDIFTLDFSGSATEYAQFSIPMPKQWDEGTVTFRAFWSSTATDTDGVTWALQAVAVSDGSTIDVAYGTAITVDDAAQSIADRLYTTDESAAITIDGTPAEEDMIFFQIFRDTDDVNDDHAEDARLHGIKLFWTNDTTVDD